MKILIVKLSSLGDIVHAMPAVHDIAQCVPHAQIDWVVERGFARIVERIRGVHRVVPCDLRRWRKSPLSHTTRADWRAFREALRLEAYDAIIDIHGLTKSALIAHTARLAPGGKRYALANRTEGSGYEAPTRWFADIAIRVQARLHAVTRSRDMCAQALGYTVPAHLHYGLECEADDNSQGCIALVHGTSRDDKLWPESRWIELGKKLIAEGFTLGLPQGSDEENARAERLAAALNDGGDELAQVWPRMDLAALTDRLGGCAGVVGVDSGISHIAVALDLPHVQIYNFETAWRTGPIESPRQKSVFAQPTPAVEAVWLAWQEVRADR